MNKLSVVIGCCVGMCVAAISFTGCGRPQQDENTITVWHWMTDRDETLQELAAQYKDKTGITIKLDLYAPSDAYTQKIVSSSQARVLPDIFGILDKKSVFASFIKNNFVADLTAEFKKNNMAWEKVIFEKALAVNAFEEGNVYDVTPGIYGVPIDVTNIQMVYNKNLLNKAGIMNPPQTFSDFLDAVEALRRVGISGLVSGWGELWMAEAFASNYAFNIMGQKKIMETYRGNVPYTDEDWVRVFALFETLREKDALIEGIVTKPNKDAEQDFALERAAFAFNGSWCVNVYHGMNNDLNYGAMLPPPINPERPMQIWGGAGSSFVVNNDSPRKQKAIDFLKWLTASEQQAYLAKETKNLPSNRKALDAIPPLLSGFAQAMDSTTHPTVWPVNEHPLVLEAFNKGIQSIIIGEKSPEQVAREVQDVKERELQKEADRQ